LLLLINKIGSPGASERAATEVLNLLN